MGKRASGKKLIGFQASEELRRSIDDWLETHPYRSITDFLLSACLEKLKAEGIRVDFDRVLVDGRFRRPPAKFPSVKDSAYVLNEKGVTAPPENEVKKICQ